MTAPVLGPSAEPPADFYPSRAHLTARIRSPASPVSPLVTTRLPLSFGSGDFHILFTPSSLQPRPGKLTILRVEDKDENYAGLAGKPS